MIHTATLARQQPHLNSLETHRSVTFIRRSATTPKKVWCRSCSYHVPVVLGGFVGRLGYPRPPNFDGTGVPWVLTGTHHPSKMMESSEPFVVGVVVVVMSSCSFVSRNTRNKLKQCKKFKKFKTSVFLFLFLFLFLFSLCLVCCLFLFVFFYFVF